MHKSEWIKYFHTSAIEDLFLQLDLNQESTIDLDVLTIIKGDLYYKYSLIYLITLLNNTDILKCHFSLFIDDIFMSSDIYGMLADSNINLIPIEEKTLSCKSGLFKFDPLIKNKFNNDLMILDCDLLIRKPFSFSKIKKEELHFIDSNHNNEGCILPFCGRYGWAKSGGFPYGYNEFVNILYEFINKINPIEYEKFIDIMLRKPIYNWPNCGIGYIPHDVLKDPNFISLCNFMRDKICLISDEMVYYLYINFLYDKEMKIFSDLKINTKSEWFNEVNDPEIIHFHTSPGEAEIEETLKALNNIDSSKNYLKLNTEINTTNKYFHLTNTYGISCLGDTEIQKMVESNDYFFQALNTEMISTINKEEDGYYFWISIKGEIKTYKLFEVIPRLILLEGIPGKLERDSGIQIKITDAYTRDILLSEFITL